MTGAAPHPETISPADALSVARRADLHAPSIRRHPVDSAAFVTAMERARAKQTREEEARGAAEDFIAAAMIEPVLKQLRTTNQAAPPFAPSDGEKKFGALLDTEVAKRIVRSGRFPLVDRVASDLLKHGVRRLEAARDAGSAAAPALAGGVNLHG